MNRSLAYFDLETTSPEPATCGAVQVGLLKHHYNDETGKIDETVLINEICDPGMEVSDGAAAVHGITAEMIKGKRVDMAVLGEAYDWFHRNQENVIFCGHNFRSFDLPILKRLGCHAVGADWELRATFDPLAGINYIDTLVLAQRLLHMVPGGHRLGELYTWITGSEPVGAHDAAGDCRMVATLVQYFCAALKMDIEQLAKYCAETRVLQVCTYKKHKGKLWGRGPFTTHVPFFYAKWMAENFDSPTPDLAATLKFHYNLRFKSQ